VPRRHAGTGPTAAIPAMNLIRPSFRQLLVVAFVLMAAALAAVSLRGLYTLEQFIERSGDSAARTLTASGHAERLTAQALTMERAARQFLVLGDATLREAYTRAAGEAAEDVQALLASASIATGLAAEWQEQQAAIAAELALPGRSPARDDRLVRQFGELDRLHARMAEQVRSDSARRAALLQAELEAGRIALARQVAGAIAVALVLALALALALARPLQRVQRAIVALGENRLEQRIEIRGPSDVRAIGRRLDWLRQRLVELEADKSRFLRHVSHELKTPLAALREGVALLGDEVAGPLSPGQREVARILADNTAALQARIEDLLRFNAAAFAAQRLVRRPVELPALLQRLVDEQTLQWRGRNLQCRLQGPPVLRIAADEELLGSALGNLLANAIRFSPPGASIDCMWEQHGEDVAIEIADRGPGVAAEDRERIFEPFFRGRVQPEGGLAGTGIGLSIVAETVAAHGGRVQLLPSADGAGARFRIELPHALAD
jgi:two-component system, NtrC family, sensor histidine kinase GlrK